MEEFSTYGNCIVNTESDDSTTYIMILKWWCPSGSYWCNILNYSDCYYCMIKLNSKLEKMHNTWNGNFIKYGLLIFLKCPCSLESKNSLIAVFKHPRVYFRKFGNPQNYERNKYIPKQLAHPFLNSNQQINDF